MYTLYCRIYQSAFKMVSNVLPWHQPELLKGENCLNELPKLIKTKGIKSILIVTDSGIASLGLIDGLLKGLTNEGVNTVIYDKTVPNPTIDNIEEALQLYKSNNCQGIVAFGGGSPMDCAKGVGARVARPNKSIPQMKGVLKVRKKIPPLYAIPTTAGTGSETTIAAVITDSKTHEKYAVNDTSLIPQYAVLDPTLTVNLPQHITSTTGMDALTHAVEAYIGRSNTRETKQYSRDAVKMIFENLFEAYSNGNNLAAREKMQEAAFLAGMAFTRAYVGYVHAIAHTLGGFYSAPHGLANAIILPYVLEYYGDYVHKPLAELADLVGLSASGDTDQRKAEKFIDAIKKLNNRLGIQDKVNCIVESDIPLMVKRALAESNPLYPVPKIMSKEDIMKIYYLIKE
ncbi:alcohol dehydrogenase, class IV [Desulfosporosinus orientis DSM 765]|uniref:Alcohol dehydrogenase, class IV n=1 Tax=Desulfosporosinus orientis (strain ATCC 19365 / DSM 765 / NCIMB 8382 / VKM B-1628 / Singapore I) TaxID=768706 RepID=G7WJ83_DESOD|nr:iron-containing alcohol dehydrogenase [Desulfosporosinus orientis]AET69742.1 alcohol dehydrogenase, class IV [Desulfosporosinus orientis DSM 765]